MNTNKALKKDKEADVLYSTAKTFAKTYKDEILRNYCKAVNTSIDMLFSNFTPAEIIDDLACFMYEYEEKYNEEVLW